MPDVGRSWFENEYDNICRSGVSGWVTTGLDSIESDVLSVHWSMSRDVCGRPDREK
jgi:hypothetical protein